MNAPGAIAIVPARLGSSRMPAKVLAAETGTPLVEHVVQRARKASSINRVIVAADDQQIIDALAPFNTECVLTDPDHPNGTSRLDQAAELLALPVDQIIVNVQGDEPEIDPAVIDAAVDALTRSGEPMATVASPFAPSEDPTNPSIVKAVLRAHPDRIHRALLFTRSLVPYPQDERCEPGRPRPDPAAGPFKHIGLYAYRRGFLREYVAMDPTPLEQAERLEQLRVLEHGLNIAVAIRETTHHGIDTPAQYAAFVERFRRREQNA